jgi:WD40 repeat protein
MNNVFISYSRRDKDFVEKLVSAFKADGRDVWVDWEDIPLTADWMNEIHKGIEGADDFVFIISPDSISSEVCTEELDHALKHHKRLVPVLYRDVKDYREVNKSLASHNWIMFNNPDNFDHSFSVLLKALDTDLEYTRSHTRLLQRALEWEAKNRNPSLLLRGTDLTEAENWLGSAGSKVPRVTPLQTEYTLESRKRAARFQQLMIGTLTLAFIASIMLTVVAVYNGDQARVAQNAAQTQAAIATAAQGEALVAAELAAERADDIQSLLLADNAEQTVDENSDLAIVLALEANKLDSPPARAQRILADIAYAPGIKRIFQGFKGAVTSVAFSPDRERAVSGSYDGTTTVWNVNNGARIFSINEQALPVKSVAYSPNGRLVASGLLDGSILVMDAKTGEIRNRLGGIRTRIGHTATVNTLTFSADSQRLYSGGADDLVIVWNLQTNELHRSLTGHSGDVNTLAVSPDGSRLYSGSADKRIIVWNLETMRVQTQFIVNAASVLSMALSADGIYGVSSSSGNDLNDLVLWNASTGEIVRRFGDAFGVFRINSPVNGVSFTPDSKRVVSASQDGTLKVWEVGSSGRGIANLQASADPLVSVSVASDGRSIITGSNANPRSTMMLWDIDTGAVIGYLEGHNDQINDVAYSPDGMTIATASDDFDIILWDAEDFEIQQRLAGHNAGVYTLAYSSDGSLLASGGDDGYIFVWGAATGEVRGEFSIEHAHIEGKFARVDAVAFMPNGTQIAAGLDDSRVVIVDLNGNLIKEFKQHQRRILSLAVSPDGRYIVSGAAEGETLLWNIEQGTVEKELIGQTERVLALAFSSDGSRIISGADQGRILAWDTASGAVVRQFENTNETVWSVQFNPVNARYALSGGGDNDGSHSVKLWDVETGEAIRLFANTHTAPVFGVAFSPNGQYAVSVSRDQTGVVWRMPFPQGLIEWVRGNRYLPALTCDQKLVYRIVRTCEVASNDARVQERIR